MTYLKIAAAALAVLLAFTGGYRYAAALYEKDAAELREAEAVAGADMGRKQYAKMVDAMDALAGLRAELSRARADADSVRRLRVRRTSQRKCRTSRGGSRITSGNSRSSRRGDGELRSQLAKTISTVSKGKFNARIATRYRSDRVRYG